MLLHLSAREWCYSWRPKQGARTSMASRGPGECQVLMVVENELTWTRAIARWGAAPSWEVDSWSDVRVSAMLELVKAFGPEPPASGASRNGKAVIDPPGQQVGQLGKPGCRPASTGPAWHLAVPNRALDQQVQRSRWPERGDDEGAPA